jgi:hypothetical protein
MVANVFFVIIPAHRELIRAKEAGREPDPAPALERSAVGAQQLPDAPGRLRDAEQPLPESVRAQLRVVGARRADGDRAWIRHFFNLRHAGRNAWWIPVTAALGSRRWRSRSGRPAARAQVQPGPRRVSFSQARAIVQQRCMPCHSQSPKLVPPRRSGSASTPQGDASRCLGDRAGRGRIADDAARDATA